MYIGILTILPLEHIYNIYIFPINWYLHGILYLQICMTAAFCTNIYNDFFRIFFRRVARAVLERHSNHLSCMCPSIEKEYSNLLQANWSALLYMVMHNAYAFNIHIYELVLANVFSISFQLQHYSGHSHAKGKRDQCINDIFPYLQFITSSVK